MARPRKGWRYIAQRFTGTGVQFLDFSMPLKDVTITDNLTGNNELTGAINPAVANYIAPDGMPLLTEWRTAVWAEHDGHIRGGGIVTHCGESGPAWSVECTGFTGYLKDLPYTSSRFFVEADPLDIYRHIWSHVQSQPGGDLDFEIANTKTDIKIGVELEQAEFDTQAGPVSFESGPYKLAWYQTHDLEQNAVDLADETPFDWYEWHDWDGDVIRHHLDLGYPRIGKRRNDLRFAIGENVSVIPDIEREGADYATEALVLGAGEGAAMIRGADSRKITGLRRVAVISDPSLRSVKSANARANAEMSWRSSLDEITSIQVRDTPHAPIGSVKVGDEIAIAGRTEWRDVDTWVRVLSRSITPEQGDVMELSVARTDRLVS